MRKWMLLLVCGAAACSTAGAEEHAGGQVPGDSIHAMPVMIERFRARHAEVHDFGADAPRTLDELVDRFAHALARGDAAGLRRLAVSEAEFAWLYFPTSMFARKPYAQPPEIAWLLMEQNGLKGETRLLRRFGGRPLDVRAVTCESQPTVEGRNRVHDACTLTLALEDGSVADGVRLFGSVVERNGRWKFLSYANRL